MNNSPTSGTPAISIRGGSLSFGTRSLWDNLTLDIGRGEYFAVLGPNGSGKSTFLKVVLGLMRMSAGEVSVLGRPARAGNPGVGYIPQQKAIATSTPMRARDLVGLGVDGHRWGIRLSGRKYRAKVDELLEAVGATEYANVPVGLLSGGEQQRLRVAQALANDPKILLADEALLSLDLNHQYAVAELIHRFNRDHGLSVVFVTHEINPIIEHVDRVLYLANGRFTVGAVDEVMQTQTLSELYGTPVNVLKSNGRYVIVGQGHSGGTHLVDEGTAGLTARDTYEGEATNAPTNPAHSSNQTINTKSIHPGGQA
ncbi:MAG: ATP-binding cassette domain-containing protein [Rothia dentocariosa]|uniref:metal ABC transporter ATP-binding protein n=1 Tax=Rothia aeria TaxID=172042 RepID=UPI001CB09EA5|nr:ATP-binding cassette domain-containing protein [Rothia aeria]MBF1653364.1 ATP-binding cassette domain-containing protein [Rothia dentocariosa]